MSRIKKPRPRWLIGLDCDGVLTDYKCYFNANGKLFKVFNSKDSYAFKELRDEGHLVYILTSDKENFPLLKARSRTWKVQAIHSADKRSTLMEVMKNNEGSFQRVCFVGNGPEDLVVADIVDHFYAPLDARIEVRKHPKVDIMQTLGGEGVMDEILEKLRQIS